MQSLNLVRQSLPFVQTQRNSTTSRYFFGRVLWSEITTNVHTLHAFRNRNVILATEMVTIVDGLIGFQKFNAPVYFVDFTDKVGPSRFREANTLSGRVQMITVSAVVLPNVNEKFVYVNTGREKAIVSDRFLKEVLSLSPRSWSWLQMIIEPVQVSIKNYTLYQ